MYPVLSRTETVRYVSGRLDGSQDEHDLKMSTRGVKGEDWIDPTLDTLDEMLDRWRALGERQDQAETSDRIEGVLSPVIFEGLRALPAKVLTDRGFWRYCSAYLYDFILWRQPASTLETLLEYFGARYNSLGRECVPLRMFDRALIAHRASDEGAEDKFALARIGASDVWKSHILRVLNGNAPYVAAGLLSEVASGELRTHDVREVAKRLRRTRANVLFEVLDREQASELVIREILREDPHSTT